MSIKMTQDQWLNLLNVIGAIISYRLNPNDKTEANYMEVCDKAEVLFVEKVE